MRTETAPQLKRIVARYREELARLGIRVKSLYLYGSYARDTHHEGSDIDLIVVSSDFARFNTRERLEILGVAAARVLEPIQACGFTPEEIEQGVTSFWSHILEHEALPI